MLELRKITYIFYQQIHKIQVKTLQLTTTKILLTHFINLIT